MTLTRKYDPFSHHGSVEAEADRVGEEVDGLDLDDPAPEEISLITPAEVDADMMPTDEELAHRAQLIQEFFAELDEAPADAEVPFPAIVDFTGTLYRFTGGFEVPDGAGGVTGSPAWTPVDEGEDGEDGESGEDESATEATETGEVPADAERELMAALAAVDEVREPDTRDKPRRRGRRK